MARLIDADAVEPALAKWIEDGNDYRLRQEVIDDIPTIDAEPVRHGRWVKDDLYNTVCSVCGERIPCVEEYDTDDDCGGTYDVEIDETPRCPICGAKMDGGSENG